MPSYIPEFHDIGILRSDGTTKVGLKLARDPQTNQPIYRTVNDDYFVNRAYASALDYAATDPQSELRMIYTDWRRGFGQYIYDSSDTKRYLSSIGCDLRFKDMAVAGPVASTVTLPTVTAVAGANLDLETWTDANTPGTWVEDAGVTRNDVVVDQGTYSALYQMPAIVEERIVLHQSLTWNNEYRSRVMTFTARVQTSSVAAGRGSRIAIYDGVGRTYSSYNAGAGAYETLTVTRVLNAAATELTLEWYVKDDNTGFNAYLDNCTFTPPTIGAIVARAEFNDSLYIAYGNILAKLNSGGTAFTYVYSFPATITDLAVHGSYLYIALGTSTAYWYMSTAEAFTLSTAAVNTFQYFATVYTSAQTLYGNDGANTIRSTTNPLNGGVAWSAQTTVGSSADDITDMIQKAGALYIMKEDMPYYLNSAGAVQNDLAPECASLRATTSGKNVIEWLKKLYIPVGAQGLLETDGTTNTWRNPSSYSTNLGDFVGRVQALAADEEWLFAIVDNSTKVEVLAGREETVDGTTEWVWHPICEITLAGCQTAWVSSVVQKRLWITSTSSSDSLYYIPLPTGYGNITSDTNRAFKTSSYFITPFYHGGFKSTSKAFIELISGMNNTVNTLSFVNGNANSYIDCGAIYNSQAKFAVSLWFKLDSDHTPASGTVYLWGKYADANNYIMIALGLGQLYFFKYSGGVQVFSLALTQTTYTAGVWYHVVASISSSAGARFRLNGGTALTSADVSALPNGGNVCIGNLTTSNTGGFDGQIASVSTYTDDLTTTEEVNLASGILTGDEDNWWRIDEGTGTTITSYGATANNGTAGSAVSWTTDDGGLVYWQAHYQKLGDASWTSIGNLTSSSLESLYIPVDSNSANPVTTMMRFKFTAITKRRSDTPVMYTYSARAILYPDIREIIECEVVAGDYVHDKEGSLIDGVSAAYVETVIDEARSATWPVTFYDPWGNTLTVKMLPSNPYSFITYDKSGENKEQHFILRLQKVALS